MGSGAAPLAAAPLAPASAAPASAVPATAAPASAVPDPPAKPAPDVTAGRLWALMAGSLPAGPLPVALFDIDVRDEGAVQLEAARLRALVRGLEGGGAISSIDQRLWRGRLALDLARLAFYELPAAKRAALLAARPASPVALASARPAGAIAADRATATVRAGQAGSEAERLVQEELVRMLDLEASVQTAEKELAREREALVARRDATIGWQRRLREAEASSPAADAAHEAIRAHLRETRATLTSELADEPWALAGVPALPPDVLAEVPPGVDVTEAAAARSRVALRVARLHLVERAFAAERLATLVAELTQLNRARLELHPYLSASKRETLGAFDFGPSAPAGEELRQLLAITRYHRHLVTGWLASLARPGEALRSFLYVASGVLIPWTILLLAFAWWRRRGPEMLDQLVEREVEASRRTRRPLGASGLSGLRFLRLVQAPLAALLAFALLYISMPAGAHALLEVRLLSAVAMATLVGAFAIAAVDALFAGERAVMHSADPEIDALRMRSLRLVGRMGVAFWLLLRVTGIMVGEGTIYRWVAALAWLAVLPTLAVLVAWWQPHVFARLPKQGGGSPFRAWLLAAPPGWRRFAAAGLGGAYLLATGAESRLRLWVGGFEWARRLHAFFYRRSLDQLDEHAALRGMQPLPAALYAAFGPAYPAASWVEEGSQVGEALQAFVTANPGAVVALVGERGAGKSALARRLRGPNGPAQVVSARAGDGAAAVQAAIDAAQAAAGGATPIVLDDLQVLVRPLMGGLAAFDQLMAGIRAGSRDAAWVLAIDQSVWPFLSQARGVRPLFDAVFHLAPWTEREIAALLRERSAEAGINPDFELLLGDLGGGGDELRRREALAAREAGYYRLIWDYSDGNPRAALEVWRASLRADEAGLIHVQPLATPDARLLDNLPDATLFVLRALVQLGPARAELLREVTRAGAAEVADALRYSLRAGILIEVPQGYDLTDRWFRPVMRMLARRHMVLR